MKILIWIPIIGFITAIVAVKLDYDCEDFGLCADVSFSSWVFWQFFSFVGLFFYLIWDII
jgi:hypothetical protein